MTWPTIHRIRLAHHTARRRVALRLFAVAVALIALLPAGQPAHAHADLGPTCFLSGAGGPCQLHFPPPALLDLNQELYAATPAQAASLGVLETQAISDVLTLHGLAPADAEAVQSWGRADAEGELFALLLLAVNAPAAARTPDQQNAVDWLAAVDQRQAIAAAQAAGREYVKWAGLDQSAYQALLNRNASTDDLQAFLSTTPDNYNNPDIGLADGGYCVYRSPAPYSTEYTGYTDVTCHNQCPFICNPPTPSYDQFVKWGEADADYPWLNAPGVGSAEQSLGTGLSVGIPLAAASAAAPLGSEVAKQVARQAAELALDAALAPSEGSAEGATAVAAAAIEEGVVEGVSIGAEAAGAIAVVIAALVTAIIEGITVTNNAKLPGQLAALITGAETTPLDPAALESTSNGLGLFSLFVGATLPVPDNRTCDNAASPAGSSIVVASGVTSIGFNVPCLNATDIPAASATDPQFLIQAKGATTPSASPSITWKDAAAGTTSTARLSESWFIAQANGATVQTLRLAYTDWSGAERTAWLVGNATDGYNFVTLASSSTAADPSTCVADGTCSFGPSIDYVGPDGQDYSASVQAYTPPTGAPSYAPAVEGRPVTFDANGYAPGSAVGPIMYGWEFQQTGCGNQGFGADLCPDWARLAQKGQYPDYGVSVAGATTAHVFPTSGQYLVRLTAQDATGKRAVDTFTVVVGDAPPALALAPACPLATPCDTRTGDVGTSLTLSGAITHAGRDDTELVLINWGDGSSEDIGSIGPPRFVMYGVNPVITLTSYTNTGLPHATLSDAHTYTTGGTYQATVTVLDQGGGATSQTVVETINNPAPTTRGLDLTSAAPVNCGSLPVGPSSIPPAPAVAAIGSSPIVTVTGGGFVPGSTVQWNGAPLATTYLSSCQLTAQVPATATTGLAADVVTVVNPAPGGGTSNPQILYITPAHNAVTTATLAASSDPKGDAAAVVGGSGAGTSGSVGVDGSGAGIVAVAQLSGNPAPTPLPAGENAYVSVVVPDGSAFTSVKVTDCNLGGGSVLYAYDSSAAQWTRVAGQTYDATTGCITVTLGADSVPNLSQAGGVLFGVRNAPPVVGDPGAQNVQYGSPVRIPVSATDVEAADQLTLHASGLPAGLSLTDNGDGTGTISGTVTAPAGPYTATLTANDGYSDATPVTVPVTVTTAPLTITASSPRLVYNGTVPAITPSYSGFVNHESAAALTTAPICSATAPRSGAAGTYTTSCTAAVAPNYSIGYVPGTLTISKAATTVSLAAAPASSVFGQAVTVTATVAVQSPGAGQPGGTVEFKDGTADIGGCSAQPVDTTTATATCTTSSLNVATHSITATYSGDPNFTGSSTAVAVTQTVNKAATSTTLGSSATAVTAGQPVTFTATVAAVPPGAGLPTGSVTFTDGTTTLGNGSLSTSGGVTTGRFRTSGLSVGAHAITATYGGDGHFLASTGVTLTQYINTNLSGYPTLASGAYNLANANLSGGYFVGLNLAGASLSGANLTNAVFLGANLTGANLSNSNYLGGVTFTNATLQNANLSNSNLKGATFSGVNLSGVNFSNSNLTGATGLKSATLTGVIWSKTACPDGTTSSQDGGTCLGHL